jgi:hypothetical protein
MAALLVRTLLYFCALYYNHKNFIAIDTLPRLLDANFFKTHYLPTNSFLYNVRILYDFDTAHLFGECVGGFGDTLELRFALKVQEDGGFFNETAL